MTTGMTFALPHNAFPSISFSRVNTVVISVFLSPSPPPPFYSTTALLVWPWLPSFVALRGRYEGNAPKNEEPTAGFSFTAMLHNTSRFLVTDFLAKNNMTTIKHPPKLLT